MKLSNRTRIVLLALPLVALAVALTLGGSAKASLGAFVFCEGTSLNGGFCEASPQGQGFTYQWTTTGSAFLPTPTTPAAPARSVGCLPSFDSGGDVRVTVVYPNGSTSTASTNACRPRIEDKPFVFPL